MARYKVNDGVILNGKEGGSIITEADLLPDTNIQALLECGAMMVQDSPKTSKEEDN